MVEKSINQIKSETFKALIGINLSKSLADDCSNLCCNLAKTKSPFLKDLITLLEKYKITKIKNNSINKETSNDLIAPFYGLNLIEYLASENINWSGNVIAPNYLISALLLQPDTSIFPPTPKPWPGLTRLRVKFPITKNVMVPALLDLEAGSKRPKNN